jgi:glyoxylase-like metal-dependent hydrolase (beta-lactamase superfamily II)/rhodanese-related sulfurtransferase
MVADQRTKVAAVIDPRRDIDIYIDDAKEHGFKIKHVILTHFHADFVAGHIELRDKVGARIYLGVHAKAEFDFEPLGNGNSIELGDVRLEAMETPGHTPEGITLLVFDETDDTDNPNAIFSGDTLFIGDVGRPDLLASIGVTAHELAEMLYDSLQNKILPLPDKTLVYPAHGAGSMCGKALSDKAFSTLGEQKLHNYALQPMPKDQFIKMIKADQPDAPAYFGHDALLNRQERPNLDELTDKSMKALDLDTVLTLQQSGTQVVDVRSANQFAGAHLNGSINIGIDGRFATWAGTVLNNDVSIIIIAEADRNEEAITRLGRIGFHNVKGYLKGGMESLKDRPNLISQTQRVSAASIGSLQGKTTIVDIRTKNEWEAGHIEKSINIPLNHLNENIKELTESDNLIVYCQGGYRSIIAASLLEREDRFNVFDLAGGYQAWVASKRPVIASK